MSEPYTVSQIAAILQETLEEGFAKIRVVGEISNLIKAASGHYYFSLKDERNQLHCTCWASTAKRLKFQPQSGQQVVAGGRMTFYGGNGKAQMSVESLQPVGAGAAELAKQLLIAKLRGLGWFDDARKRPLPAFPKRVALLTSSTGAAVRDMIESFAQRWPSCELIVRHTRVQGDTAPAEIAAGLIELNRVHQAGFMLDAVILGRGGGSAEDLNAFNTEVVAAAVHASRIPVVSAVGHEVDVTIADLVADARSETPSNAVTMLTPHRLELLAAVEGAQTRLRELLRGKVANARRRLDFIAARPAFTRPQDRLRKHEQHLDDLTKRMRDAIDRRLQKQHDKLAAAAGQLEAVSPLNVLKRGYSVVRQGDKIIRSASDVTAGAEIAVTLSRGTLTATVSKTSP